MKSYDNIIQKGEKKKQTYSYFEAAENAAVPEKRHDCNSLSSDRQRQRQRKRSVNFEERILGTVVERCVGMAMEAAESQSTVIGEK